jgi:multiple sugar transport system substrate-binding protein
MEHDRTTPNAPAPLHIARRVAVGMIAAGLVGAAVSPRLLSRPDPSAPPRGGRRRVVIEYWEKWTGPEGDALQRVVDRFNHSQNDIWVRRLPVSDIGTKAMVAIGGGSPPDVIGLYSYHVPLYAQAGAALPLDALADGSSRIEPSTYIPSVAQLLSHNGRLYAGISSIYTLALYRNRGVFREAGLDPDMPLSAIDEFTDVASRLTRLNTSGDIERVGFLPILPSWWPYFWPVMFGGPLYDPARNRATLTDDGTTRTFEWIHSFATRHGSSATASFAQAYNRLYHSSSDPFISGRAAMIVQGPWLSSFIVRESPSLDYVVSAVPTAPGVATPSEPAGLVEGDVLIIPRGCPHPREAFTFLLYMQRQDVQEELARAHGKSSPIAACSRDFFTTHPNRYVAMFDAIARSPRVRVLPQTPAWKEYAQLIDVAFDAIWRGADVAATLLNAESRAQQLLDMRAAREALRLGRRS